MSTPRNILLITSDQQHYDTLGSTNPHIRTPSLDRLAREGTTFTRAYCPNPTCTPTRASIITGQYPSQHGAWSLGTKLPEDVPTVGQRLSSAGYSTSLVGKAHFQPLATTPGQTSIECMPTLRDLDFWRQFHGPWYGFDHIEISRNHADEHMAGAHYAIWMEERGLSNWRDFFMPHPPVHGVPRREHRWDLPASMHYTIWTAERTIAQLERSVQEGKPFFCWSSFHDPHPPYLVPEPWDSMYDPADMPIGRLVPGEMARMPPHHQLTQEAQPDFTPWQETQFGNHGFHSHLHDEQKLRRKMAVYYGMVSFMDEQIGRILDRLDELELADNTLVVFTSDHGHFLGQHGLTAKGAFHYEDVLRVPFVVRDPGRTQAGGRSAALQSLVDLAPTFLEVAGLAGPDALPRLQGVSQLETWHGGAPVRNIAIVENRHQPTAIHLRTYIADRYKITVYRQHGYGELFDLVEDPQEVHNRWDDPAYADVKAAMLLQATQAEIAREPLPHPRIASA